MTRFAAGALPLPPAGHFWFVTLDGVPVERCVAADTDEGWVDVIVDYDASGDEVRCARRYGKVAVEAVAR